MQRSIYCVTLNLTKSIRKPRHIVSLCLSRTMSNNQKYYGFNLERYNSLLKTKSLGRPCIYVDEVDSTIKLVDQYGKNSIVVSKTQTNGIGQGDKKWESPPGCAMASMKLECEASSFLANRISFLQHLVALAIVRTLEDHNKEFLNKQYIRIKWPNDVYYVNEKEGKKCKISGVLVKSQTVDNKHIVIISFGLNVSNSLPTTCINDILSEFKSETRIHIDELVATVVNKLEETFSNFTEDTFPDIKQDYMSRLIQMNQLVDDDKHGRVEIVGIDNDGYLLAKRITDGLYCQLTSLNMT